VKPEKWLPVLEGKMDVVVDNLKINEYESSHRALTDSGVLICNVGPDMGIWWSSLRAKLLGSRAIFYEVHESFRTNPRLFAHELHYLICKLQRGEIRPKVAGRVTLNQVPKAQQLLGKGLPSKFTLIYLNMLMLNVLIFYLALFTQMVQSYVYHGRIWTPPKK
jgi:NADPH:quinone reductase-like Zn-dependent oxidoreductase